MVHVPISKVTSKETDKELIKTFHQYLDEADERDVTWLKKWHNIRKRSQFFNLSGKRLKKAVFDLKGLMIGRDMRENK